VQNRYSLMDRNSEDVLEVCEREGLGFLPWYPLASGSLPQRTRLKSMAEKYRATPAQVGLAWLLERSPVMLPIPGTSSLAHLEENVAAAQLRLRGEDVAELAA